MASLADLVKTAVAHNGSDKHLDDQSPEASSAGPKPEAQRDAPPIPTDSPDSPPSTDHHDAPNGHTDGEANRESDADAANVNANGTQAPDAQPSKSTVKDASKHVAFQRTPLGSPRLPTLDTPSGRTGPPRSFSYNFPSPRPRQPSDASPSRDMPGSEQVDGLLRPSLARQTSSEYRGALEYSDPEQREKEREAAERKERHRQTRLAYEESWNPLKWLGGIAEMSSPKDEKPPRGISPLSEKDPAGEQPEPADDHAEDTDHDAHGDETQRPQSKPTDSDGQSRRRKAARAQSLPHMSQDDTRPDGKTPVTPKWNRLRSLIPTIAHHGKEQARAGQTAVQGGVVNITDELITGGLSTLMLRLWIERDEHDLRRVPFLFHRLRIRISDSLHPLSGHKAVFRIECEYANGAMRWVIYRQLRDFISLHTHYRFANVYNRNIDAMPEFPRTSKPS